MPEPVRIAFRSFSDIKNAGTYVPPNKILLLQAGCKESVESNFKFREWWRIVEGDRLNRQFNISEDLVTELLRVLEVVSVFSMLLYIMALQSTRAAAAIRRRAS